MPRVPLGWLAEYVDVAQGTDAEEIAAHIGVSASTVRRHQHAMRTQERTGV
jgi:transposase